MKVSTMLLHKLVIQCNTQVIIVSYELIFYLDGIYVTYLQPLPTSSLNIDWSMNRLAETWEQPN